MLTYNEDNYIYTWNNQKIKIIYTKHDKTLFELTLYARGDILLNHKVKDDYTFDANIFIDDKCLIFDELKSIIKNSNIVKINSKTNNNYLIIKSFTHSLLLHFKNNNKTNNVYIDTNLSSLQTAVDNSIKKLNDNFSKTIT